MNVCFNNSNKGFSDELIIGGELGVQLFKNKLILLSRILWIHPLYNGPFDPASSNDSVFTNKIEILVLRNEVVWSFLKENRGFFCQYQARLWKNNLSCTESFLMVLSKSLVV